jgi:hypothetical protein
LFHVRGRGRGLSALTEKTNAMVCKCSKVTK